MCCLFTWMAWCFDASHRLVVFVMACLISSSVCCMLLVASLAGVAMGYNYSLAEYIDLKETNISVYIKRGVYDDEIADDFDWRRSGGGDLKNPSIQLKDQTGVGTGAQDGVQPLAAARRRSESSVFESDDQNKYEGSLMRLTSSTAGAGAGARRFEPPEPPYTTSTRSTPNLVDGLLKVADSLPGGSLERLKAIQAAARHHEAKQIELATAKFPEDPSDRIKAIEENAQIHNARRTDEQTTTTDKYSRYFNQLTHHPGFPGSGLSARKFMESNDKDISETNPPNRFRDAVFRGQLSGWPVSSDTVTTTDSFFEYDVNYRMTMPTVPTVKPLLVRPEPGKMPRVDWDMKKLPSSANDMRKSGGPKPKLSDMPKGGRVYSDYDESHGLPIRKKRSDKKGGANRESFMATPLFSSEIKPKQNDLRSGDILETVSTNVNGSLPNIIIKQSAERSSPKNKTQPNKLEGFKNPFSHSPFIELFLTSNDDNSSDSVKQSEINGLEHLTTSSKTKKDVHFKPRKRRKHSKGYEYKTQGNKVAKSIWWRISDDAQERWNRIILYFRNPISPKSGSFSNSEASDKSLPTSSDKNQNIFINKMVAIN